MAYDPKAPFRGQVYGDLPIVGGAVRVVTPSGEASGNSEPQTTGHELPLLKDSGERAIFSTGAQRDRQAGKGLPSLAPSWVWWLVSRVYEGGAVKYSTYGECKCVQIASKMFQSTHAEGADHATTGGIGKPTWHTQNDKRKTEENGACDIQTKYEKLTESTPQEPKRNLTEIQSFEQPITLGRQPDTTGLQPESTTQLSASHVDCAEQQKGKGISITAQRRARLGGRYATDAILGSDLWRSGEGNGQGQHLSGCPSLEIVKSGKRNWEKGMPLSQYIDSAERHLAKLKAGLRDEPHASQIIWNLAGYVFTGWLIKLGHRPKELNDMPSQLSADPGAIAEPLSEYEYTSLRWFFGLENLK